MNPHPGFLRMVRQLWPRLFPLHGSARTFQFARNYLGHNYAYTFQSDFPDLPFPLSRPIRRTYKEHSRQGPSPEELRTPRPPSGKKTWLTLGDAEAN